MKSSGAALKLNLRQVREAAGLTQVEVAKRLHVNQSTVSVLEAGYRGTIRLKTLLRYLNAVNSELRITVELNGRRLVLM